MKHVTKPTTVHLITAVWGEEHTGRFLELAVPSQLGTGNLAGLAELAPLDYHVYTREEDERAMGVSDGLRRVAEHARLRFHTLPDEMIAGQAHAAMSRAHQDILAAARARDEPVVFLAPELILAQGSLAAVALRLAEGARLILGGGMRLEAAAAATIKDRFGGDGTIEAPPRQLLPVALSHLHPMTQAYFWDAARPTIWPANLFWRIGDDGVLAHCFHLHPLVVWPERDAVLSGTIDDRFIDEVCSPESIYVSQDSDELLMVTLDENPAADQRVHANPTDPWRVAAWAVEATGQQHRRQVGVPIRFHGSDLDDSWQRAEREAEKIVRQVRRRLLLLDAVLPRWRRARASAAQSRILRGLYRSVSGHARSGSNGL